MSNQNPFGNSGYPPNPYASPGPMGYSLPPGCRPHRGAVILTLGIIGLVFSTAGAAFCIIMPIVGLALSIPAWVMGAADLKAINRGEMDPQGKGPTTAGMITGIAGTAIGGLIAVIAVIFIIGFLGLMIFAGATSNM